MLQSESASVLASFIFEDLLCRWGAISEIITDNGPAFIEVLCILASRYNVHHIRISPYNSQANGVVEWRHYNVRKAIVKSCKGVESHWPHTIHSVFWAEQITILRSTGVSPYFMAHGVEPLFPFDLAEATFLVPLLDANSSSTSELIAWHERQLQKCQEDLDTICDRVLMARFTSIKHFKAAFKSWIKDFDFRPGSLILVRNSKVEKELNCKTKPRYLGPMVVLR